MNSIRSNSSVTLELMHHSMPFLIVLLVSCEAFALDLVTLKKDGREVHLKGECQVTAEDGGLLVLTPDGVLWTVPPEELIEHTKDDVPFAPYPREELSRRLMAELPAGFDTFETTHYLICYNTSKAYAQWCGSLFERLYLAFTNYWSRKGFELHDPQFPLVALVFADRESYIRYARKELGDAAESIIGYYNLRSNRMTMYDLTGVQALRRPSDRRGSPAEINQMLARPEAERTVATVIHEATHQIAFNCGLQTRYADIPLWVSEGIAVYFETPDLRSARGWRTIGAVNAPRLAQFRQYLSRRPSGSLGSLVADDARLRDSKQAADAYAEAWALNYFLLLQRGKQYDAYLKMLSEKGPLLWDKPEARLQQFTDAFGDLEQLDTEFVRFMGRRSL
jgi:hypothetical protein